MLDNIRHWAIRTLAGSDCVIINARIGERPANRQTKKTRRTGWIGVTLGRGQHAMFHNAHVSNADIGVLCE